jgi:hypothetical protein
MEEARRLGEHLAPHTTVVKETPGFLRSSEGGRFIPSWLLNPDIQSKLVENEHHTGLGPMRQALRCRQYWPRI